MPPHYHLSLIFRFGRFVNIELFSRIDLCKGHGCGSTHMIVSNKFTGKMFQPAQLTLERFLTLDYSWEMFFWYLPNWTSTELRKFGAIFRKYSGLKNCSYQKMSFTKNVVLNLYSSTKFFLEWFLTYKIESEVWFLHFVKVQLGRYQKNISEEWSRVKNLSCVSCAACNVFPINLFLSCCST